MSEEKKEEKMESQKTEKPVEAAQKTEAQAEAPHAPQGEAKPAEKKLKPKKEKPANCAGCKKSIRKKRWYYRNGKTYCTKRCWQTTLKKKEEASAGSTEPKPQAS